MTEITMNSSKPYFFRAIYEWIEDNGLTTHIMVNADIEGVDVPSRYINDGEIVLNISSSSIQLFENTNDILSFEARFDGRLTPIFIPIKAIKAVFSRENQQGIFFEGHLVGEKFDLVEPDPVDTVLIGQSSKALTSMDEKPTSLESEEPSVPNNKKPLAQKGKKSSTQKNKKSDKKSSHLKIIK